MIWAIAILASALLVGGGVMTIPSIVESVGWPLWLLIGGLILALVVGLAEQIKCPRCRLSVISDGGPEPAFRWRKFPKLRCPGCGRNRIWVWPFQYLIRPEHSA
jgi:hypothetical protein